jgi:glutaminase
MFSALVLDDSNTVSSKFFLEFLERSGLQRDDPRLIQMFSEMSKMGAVENDTPLDLEAFSKIVSGEGELLLSKCLSGSLCMPDFSGFTSIIKEVYEEVLPDRSGENAQYIPELARVDPEQFAISVTTVDGQHFSIGDATNQFCIQSCSKPISYLLALKEFGLDYVHNSVGTEPSGRAFNEMCLKDTDDPERKIPHNPCINAGAIMTVSMVEPLYTRAVRLQRVMEVWKRLSTGGGEEKIGYDDATYKSESSTAAGNWCLGYMMKKYNAFPPCFSDLGETLELYFQICSILSTCKAMSVMAATLANGGLNPVSGDRIFNPEEVRNALPIMLMAGMYDYSGQWAFDIGVPAKSGVGGCVYVVIPNLCGIAIWSPRLDSIGNSHRGVKVCQALVRRLQFHNFEVFSGLARTKVDPRMPKRQATVNLVSSLLFAASQGDVSALSMIHESGGDLFVSDYDNRTAMHLAATEGHTRALAFLLRHVPKGSECAKIVNAVDRWGATPLDDAQNRGHAECVAQLKLHGAAANNSPCKVSPDDIKRSYGESRQYIDASAPMLLSAAADGSIDELVRLAASGINFRMCDYDLRTCLHLAASNGHLVAVKYICQRDPSLSTARDRWNNTPLDDAKLGGHSECAEVIAKFGIVEDKQ